MIYIKTEDEIRVIREGGKILANILKTLSKQVKPGARTLDLEKTALKMISEAGGRPAFLNYSMGGGIFFPSALCVSINEEVVHGSALPDREIKSGDIVDLDIGMEWPISPEKRASLKIAANPHSKLGGYYTDTCVTVGAGKVSAAAKKLMLVTKECLDAAILEAKVGNCINDIGRAVENIANKHNYGIVRDLVGHGLGYFAHEAPDVPNYTVPARSSDNVRLKEGMVIAIEPMINIGTGDVLVASNDYTIISADKSLSAHFEHTIAITKDGPQILSAL